MSTTPTSISYHSRTVDAEQIVINNKLLIKESMEKIHLEAPNKYNKIMTNIWALYIDTVMGMRGIIVNIDASNRGINLKNFVDTVSIAFKSLSGLSTLILYQDQVLENLANCLCQDGYVKGPIVNIVTPVENEYAIYVNQLYYSRTDDAEQVVMNNKRYIQESMDKNIWKRQTNTTRLLPAFEYRTLTQWLEWEELLWLYTQAIKEQAWTTLWIL